MPCPLTNASAARVARPALRQLSTRSRAAFAPSPFKTARASSTLSAQPVEVTVPTTFDLSAAVQQRFGLSTWADEADKWLATRRALEHASDNITLSEFTGFAPHGSLNVWTDEFVAWAEPATQAGTLASTSYASACMGAAATHAATGSGWAHETQQWLAQRRHAEHLSDKHLVQEVVWFK